MPIGAYVLEQACRQARRWTDAAGSGVGPTVSVNLSAASSSTRACVPLVRGALERSGVDPAAISLEITESVLMDDVAASGAVLSRAQGPRACACSSTTSAPATPRSPTCSASRSTA